MSTRPPTAAVIGWPIAHSKSPSIFHHWLARHGVDGLYERIAVPPERIDAFLEAFSTHGLVGANVTVPHKEAALRHAEPDAVARAIGAVNTLWLEDGALLGTNSDCAGFMRNLDDAAPGWAEGAEGALVLGAGGAARAVAYGLLERGVRPVLLANRTRDRAEALAAAFPGTRVIDWARRDAAVGEVGLVVNTTVLGMKGKDPLALDLSAARPGTVVADIVYTPLATPLLIDAAARGLPAVGGLGMLLHQAAVGFEKWFGIAPAVDPPLFDAVEAELAGEA